MNPNPMDMATQERADLVALLETLSPEEWERPSLCARWRVRDVAAHLISYDLLGPVGTAAVFVRGGFVVARVNQVGVDRARRCSTDEIIEQVRTHLRPSGLTAGFKGGIGLTDGVIHHQDIRRALDRPREVPAERLAFALPFAMTAPTLNGRKLSRALTLVATDLDWRAGEGPEVHATGEALLLALGGRPVVIPELAGEGASELASRLST